MSDNTATDFFDLVNFDVSFGNSSTIKLKFLSKSTALDKVASSLIL